MKDTKGLRQRHEPPSSSSVSTPPSTPPSPSIIDKVETKLLLLWEDLPLWRRDNHYILSGYRPILPSYTHSLLSLFHLHNESVNIWSHLLGAIVFLSLSLYLYLIIHPRFPTATTADVYAFGAFFAGAFLCLGMSATFHALLSHSAQASRWGNKLDYTGIVFLIVGSFVPVLYYGFFCKPKLMVLYLGLIFVLGFCCGIVSWVDTFRTSAWRPYRAMMFIGLGLSGVIPVIHGLTIYTYQEMEDRMSMSFVILQGALYILGAVLYAIRWPERTSPGAFDIWGSSHQIFHIFVLMAAATHLYGMAKAFDYHHTIMGSKCLID